VVGFFRNHTFLASRLADGRGTNENNEQKAEAEYRGIVKGLDNKRNAGGVGKSQSEKVALAHVFARDSTSALLAIKTKHGLTEEQTERICARVAKEVGKAVS
jgi:hypothetical protein